MASSTVSVERTRPGTDGMPGTPLAELLVRLRRGSGLSQTELARRSGLSVRAIRDLEVGVTAKPRQWSLRAVAEALGLSADERALLFTTASAVAAPRPEAPPALAPAGEMVGRAAELRALIDLVRGGVHRLITVTGPGGVGKSRLAAEAVTVLTRQAGMDVYTVDLGGVAEPGMVGEVIAEALGAGGRSRLDPVSRIAAQLRARRFVLVLDGFERLLPAGGTVRALIARCPGVTIVTTSRVPLRTGDERELRVDPLPVPAAAGTDLARLAAVPAMRLLVRRASASRPGFALTDDNADSVVAVCRAVDGLPLAIELAAAWLRVLEPAELAARLDRRLDLLRDGPRGLPERHRSLRATIEYSLDVVSPDARTLFAWLAPFPAGVRLGDLESVTRTLDRDREWLLSALGNLVDASLLRPRREGDHTRYVLPDAMRELAEELLTSTVDDEPVRRAVAVRYLDRLREAGLRADGDGFASLDSDVDNVRAAMAWATTAGTPLIDVALVDAASRYCELRGRFNEGRAALLSVARTTGDPVVGGRALVRAGYLTRFLNDFEEAERLVRAGMAQFRPDDDEGATLASMLLGHLADDRGDPAAGAAHTTAALASARRWGDRQAIGKALNNLAASASASGDLERAERLLLEALENKRSGPAGGVEIGRSLMNLAEVTHSAGRWAAAREYATEAVTALHRGGHPRLAANALSVLALAHLNDAPANRAAARNAIDRAVGLLPHFGEDRTLRGLLKARHSVVLAACGVSGADAALTEGAAALAGSEAWGELGLVAEYHAALLAGRHPRPAALLLGVADAIRTAAATPLEPAGRQARERATAACRDQLGDAGFAAARKRGARTAAADMPVVLGAALRDV